MKYYLLKYTTDPKHAQYYVQKYGSNGVPIYSYKSLAYRFLTKEEAIAYRTKHNLGKKCSLVKIETKQESKAQTVYCAMISIHGVSSFVATYDKTNDSFKCPIMLIECFGITTTQFGDIIYVTEYKDKRDFYVLGAKAAFKRTADILENWSGGTDEFI